MPTEKLTRDNYQILIDELRASADGKYRDFHSSLVPNEEKDRILGVRMPRLREIAKEIGRNDARGFLEICGDDYYEERILRAIVTGLIKPEGFDDLRALSDGFLPYVNSWAVCDCFCSGLKGVKKYRAEFFEHIGEYLSGGDWEQRRIRCKAERTTCRWLRRGFWLRLWRSVPDKRLSITRTIT